MRTFRLYLAVSALAAAFIVPTSASAADVGNRWTVIQERTSCSWNKWGHTCTTRYQLACVNHRIGYGVDLHWVGREGMLRKRGHRC